MIRKENVTKEFNCEYDNENNRCKKKNPRRILDTRQKKLRELPERIRRRFPNKKLTRIQRGEHQLKVSTVDIEAISLGGDTLATLINFPLLKYNSILDEMANRRHQTGPGQRHGDLLSDYKYLRSLSPYSDWPPRPPPDQDIVRPPGTQVEISQDPGYSDEMMRRRYKDAETQLRQEADREWQRMWKDNYESLIQKLPKLDGKRATIINSRMMRKSNHRFSSFRGNEPMYEVRINASGEIVKWIPGRYLRFSNGILPLDDFELGTVGSYRSYTTIKDVKLDLAKRQAIPSKQMALYLADDRREKSRRKDDNPELSNSQSIFKLLDDKKSKLVRGNNDRLVLKLILLDNKE